jgi:hypothetical protein
MNIFSTPDRVFKYQFFKEINYYKEGTTPDVCIVFVSIVCQQYFREYISTKLNIWLVCTIR